MSNTPFESLKVWGLESLGIEKLLWKSFSNRLHFDFYILVLRMQSYLKKNEYHCNSNQDLVLVLCS
jgi:hypothetical protein